MGQGVAEHDQSTKAAVPDVQTTLLLLHAHKIVHDDMHCMVVGASTSNTRFAQALVEFFDDITEGARTAPRQRRRPEEVGQCSCTDRLPSNICSAMHTTAACSGG